MNEREAQRVIASSLFSELCSAAGLSIREAADYLGIRHDTARSYATGRREPHPNIVVALSVLVSRIDGDAAQMIERHRKMARRRNVSVITLDLASIRGDYPEPAIQALRGRVAAALMVEGYSVSWGGK